MKNHTRRTRFDAFIFLFFWRETSQLGSGHEQDASANSARPNAGWRCFGHLQLLNTYILLQAKSSNGITNINTPRKKELCQEHPLSPCHSSSPPGAPPKGPHTGRISLWLSRALCRTCPRLTVALYRSAFEGLDRDLLQVVAPSSHPFSPIHDSNCCSHKLLTDRLLPVPVPVPVSETRACSEQAAVCYRVRMPRLISVGR
jgi:hypothetical protein